MNRSMIVRPDEKIAAKTTAITLLALFTIAYVIGAISVEVFNGVTTFVQFGNLFNLMVGTNETRNANLFTTLATLAMTAALMLSDVGALARLFTPASEDKQEPAYIWGLFFLWTVVGMFNAILTYMFVSDSVWKIQKDMMSPDSQKIMEFFPIVITCIVYCTRAINMFMLGKVLDKWMHGKYTTSPLMAVGVEFFNHDPKKNGQQSRSSTPVAPGPRPGINQSRSPIPSNLNSASIPSRPQVKNQPMRPGMSGRPAFADEEDREPPNYHSLSGQ